MNSKFLNIVKNFSYTLSSNIISLIVSTLVILIVPKLIGVMEYGYWQLYLFYTSYVGFLHFGWNDGIYLRYGGKKYKDLNKPMFFSQFYMLVLSQILIALIILLSSLLFAKNSDKNFIFNMVAICLVLTNVRWMLIFILQATNRIKEYAQITIIGRVLYILIISAFLLFGNRNYKLLILADIIGRIVSLGYAMYCCKEIVFRKLSSFYFSFNETISNISVGIKLMFATIASMLIIGIIRFGIEQTWDVSTFGKVSLTLSASNLLMLFINAVGIIVFPILRRTSQNKLPEIYSTMRDFLMVVLLGILIVYYPLKELLTAWLPKYSDSLNYMALLFPICLFEGKMALLINTYFKTLRKEALMLKINLISLGLSVLTTLLFSTLLENLNLLISSIIFLLAFRSILAEFFLSKILNISTIKDIVLELIMTILFISTGWIINSWQTLLFYGLGYLLYIIIKKEDLKITVRTIKHLAKK